MNILMSIVFTLLGVTCFSCLCWIASGDKVFEKPLYNNILAAVFLLGCLGNFGYALYYANSRNSTKTTEISTKTPPQVDTLVSVKDGVKDTTYVYRFEDIEK